MRLNKQMLEADPEAKKLLEAVEKYTLAFNAFQAVRIYGLPEDGEVFILARQRSSEALAELVKIVFPQYVID